MTKLVLGIIAIGLLQLTFVAYSHLQEPLTVAMLPEQPSAADGTADVPTLIPELPPVSSDRVVSKYDNAETRVRAKSVTPDVPAAPRSGAIADRTSAPAARRIARTDFAPANPARSDDFKTVVISYTGRETGSSSCDTPAVEKPKNRSLMAKTSPIVKKPWEFLKAVGSKLN